MDASSEENKEDNLEQQVNVNGTDVVQDHSTCAQRQHSLVGGGE